MHNNLFKINIYFLSVGGFLFHEFIQTKIQQRDWSTAHVQSRKNLLKVPLLFWKSNWATKRRKDLEEIKSVSKETDRRISDIMWVFCYCCCLGFGRRGDLQLKKKKKKPVVLSLPKMGPGLHLAMAGAILSWLKEPSSDALEHVRELYWCTSAAT